MFFLVRRSHWVKVLLITQSPRITQRTDYTHINYNTDTTISTSAPTVIVTKVLLTIKTSLMILKLLLLFKWSNWCSCQCDILNKALIKWIIFDAFRFIQASSIIIYRDQYFGLVSMAVILLLILWCTNTSNGFCLTQFQLCSSERFVLTQTFLQNLCQ